MPEQTEHFNTEALDVLQEWMRQIAVPTDHPPELEDQRVVWTAPGVFHLEDQWGTSTSKDYVVTVIVEPAERWRQATWREVAEEWDRRERANAGAYVRVRLGETEAMVTSAVVQRWHVDPRSPDRYPRPLEHDVVAVHLAERGDTLFKYPPHGVVMMCVGEPTGPAVAAFIQGGLA
jgi:hypothetical protein